MDSQKGASLYSLPNYSRTCSKTKERTVRGHIIQLKRDKNSARNQEEMTVSTRPPKNPSHVFFGDSFISGVRPKKNPRAALSVSNFVFRLK